MKNYEDLWSVLQRKKEQNETLLLYGMGNGADKILDVLEKKGISVSGVFASDGFARNHQYRNMTVTDFTTAKALYSDFTVLLSFASAREEVLETVKKVAMERELLVPDVPVAGDTLFDAEFVSQNKEQFKEAYEVFEDESSKRVFKNAVESKLTGKFPLFFNEITTEEQDFRELLTVENYKVTVDAGAYTGDTARELLSFNGNIEKIFSVESDPKTLLRMKKKSENYSAIMPVFGAVWSKDGKIPLHVSGNRGSGAFREGDKIVEVPTIKVDTLVQNEKIDYIKYDVEGAEMQALMGSRETILRWQPELLVSAYHRSEDLFALPLYLKKEFPFYKFYLRRHRGFPTWDLNIYAVKR